MALPFLLSLGLPALGAATGGLGLGLGAASLAGIGAGLGSFLQTGDVGKGIQTGLVAGLGGKLMSSATSALSGAGAQAAQTAAGAAAPAAAQTTGNKFLASLIGEKALAAPIGATTVGGALGAAGSGFNTGLVADAMNVPTVKMPEKKTYDTSPPMPRIRSYQPKTDISSTAEEDMIRYYNPVQRKNLGGIMSMSGSHPIFNQFGQQMSGYLGQAQAQANKQKVGPFVQQVEQLAKTTFGDEAFQQNLSDYTQQGDRFQGMSPNDMFNESRMSSEEQKDMVGILSGKGTSSTGAQRGVNNFAQALGRGTGSMMSMMRRPGAMGFAEGGIVSEEMNEKELIEEAVAAIKGESDNPKEILGMFLLKFGEEQLRNLVESVQSGELDETRERFAGGDKGMVNGPGDGSGKDDMVPATMDGDQDVLLTAGEFVIKKDSTDAIEKAFGGGFLDEVNDAGKDAPKKLKEKVAVA
jgi:hypothetical protein